MTTFIADELWRITNRIWVPQHYVMKFTPGLAPLMTTRKEEALVVPLEEAASIART
jgi:hypothetical protein